MHSSWIPAQGTPAKLGRFIGGCAERSYNVGFEQNKHLYCLMKPRKMLFASLARLLG